MLFRSATDDDTADDGTPDVMLVEGASLVGDTDDALTPVESGGGVDEPPTVVLEAVA